MGEKASSRKAFEFQIKELYFSFERKGKKNREFGYIKLEPKLEAVVELEENIVFRLIPELVPQEEGFEISVDEEEYFKEDLPHPEASFLPRELKATSEEDFTEEIIVKQKRPKEVSEEEEEFWDFEEETDGDN